MRLPSTLFLAAAALAINGADAADSPYYRFNGQARGDGAASAPSAGGSTVAPVPAFTASPATASYQPGGPVSLAPPASSGTTASTAYALLQGGSDIAGSLGSLCPGLSFSPATGRITGTPTGYCALTGLAYRADTPGQPSVVSDSFDIVVRSAYAVAIQPAPITLRAGSIRTTGASVSGAPYGTLAWALLGPSGDAGGVPSWVAKAAGSCGTSSLSCQVDASPTAAVAPGTYPASGSFAIRAVDMSGTTVTTQGFTVVVQPAPVTVAQTPLSYSILRGASHATSGISVTGGTAPYSYSIQTLAGTAPANATVSQANGAVTFTPSVTGTWTYKVRATSADDPSNFADAAPTTVTVTAPTSTVPKPTTSSLGPTATAFGPQTNVIETFYDGLDTTGASINLSTTGTHVQMGWAGASYRVSCIVLRYVPPTSYAPLAIRTLYGGKSTGRVVDLTPGSSGTFTIDTSSDNNGNPVDGFSIFLGSSYNVTVRVTDFRAGTFQNGACVTP